MIKNLLSYSSYFLLCWVALILIISNVSFLFGFDLHVINVIISLLLAVLLLNAAVKNIRVMLLPLSLALIICLISYVAAILFYDISWDGQGYHQETIYLLKNGWNPIYEDSHSFRIWVNLYQKGNEIIEANIYLLTEKIEAGKLLNLLLLYIAAISVWTFLDTLDLKKGYKFVIAFLTVFNPVVFTQVFTYYIDGNWYLTLVISFSSLLTYFANKKLYFLIAFVSGSVLFCSTKLTSIPVFAVFSVFSLGYYYVYYKRVLLFPYLIIIAAGFICNIHPFLTNVKQGNHILHPFAGENKIDIINQNIPELLLNRNRLERLAISLFSETGNDMKAVFPDTLKIPFTFTTEEFFINYDTRLGGFGFLFSGILVIIFILAVMLFLPRGKIDYRILSVIVFAILLSILINPASWWSRLSAQIWLLSVVLIIAGLLSKNKSTAVLSHLALLCLMINTAVPGAITALKLKQDNRTVNDFIHSVQDKTIILDLSEQFGFQQYYLKFKEKNIKYRIDKIEADGIRAPFTPDVFYKIE